MTSPAKVIQDSVNLVLSSCTAPTSEWASVLAVQLLHDACTGLIRLACQHGCLVALLVLVLHGGQGLASDGVFGRLATLLAGVSLLTLL
jgi:hypothetical protein